MNNKEYLTEERYNKMNKGFKTLYIILAIIGVALIITGILILIKNKDVDFYTISNIIAIGLIIIGIPLSVLSIGDFLRHTFTRDMISYYTEQSLPIEKEKIEKIAPSVGVLAKEISKGIKKGKE